MSITINKCGRCGNYPKWGCSFRNNEDRLQLLCLCGGGFPKYDPLAEGLTVEEAVANWNIELIRQREEIETDENFFVMLQAWRANADKH